jgi:cob(I)alamin adenosyltransferase
MVGSAAPDPGPAHAGGPGAAADRAVVETAGVVNLTRIYTRTGDDGTTSLGDGSRTTKTDARLLAYADVDEANSAIGVAVATGGLPPEIADLLVHIQNDLFDVGADLSAPIPPGGDGDHPRLRVLPDDIGRLEAACDRFNDELPALRSFVLPGGSAAAAALHLARTVVRRAERSAWAARAVHGEECSTLPAQYLNRLSDLLFILSRSANVAAGRPDVLWVPAANRTG